jgi:hypothetical protein
MEDEPKMIPTYARDKIPRALSFVASAKTLSLAFQDVPQLDFLRFWFSCDVPKALRASTEPRLVLELSYLRMSVNRFSPPRFDEAPHWDVRVGVCSRDDASFVREWLQDEGFGIARAWLQSVGVPKEFTPSRWRATFDEDSHEFHIEHKE